ncbi:leukocyte immunoglobulin-like receptor subfamily A member 6, partial [Sigmodon hispidus]
PSDGGSIMLRDGLSFCSRNPVVAGGLSKPILSAVPSNVVSIGQQVIIICEGPSDAQEYHFYHKENPDFQTPTTHQDTEIKNKTFIASIKSHHAGQYWCYYKSSAGISKWSDALELVATGVYSTKVIQTFLSIPVVSSRDYVTLQGSSQEKYDIFILMKEDEEFSRS